MTKGIKGALRFEKGDHSRDKIWELFGWREALHGWKHPRAQIFLKEKSLKNEEIEEEEIGASLRFVHSLFPPFVFLSFDGCILLKDVLVCFLRV